MASHPLWPRGELSKVRPDTVSAGGKPLESELPLRVGRHATKWIFHVVKYYHHLEQARAGGLPLPAPLPSLSEDHAPRDPPCRLARRVGGNFHVRGRLVRRGGPRSRINRCEAEKQHKSPPTAVFPSGDRAACDCGTSKAIMRSSRVLRRDMATAVESESFVVHEPGRGVAERSRWGVRRPGSPESSQACSHSSRIRWSRTRREGETSRGWPRGDRPVEIRRRPAGRGPTRGAKPADASLPAKLGTPRGGARPGAERPMSAGSAMLRSGAIRPRDGSKTAGKRLSNKSNQSSVVTRCARRHRTSLAAKPTSVGSTATRNPTPQTARQTPAVVQRVRLSRSSTPFDGTSSRRSRCVATIGSRGTARDGCVSPGAAGLERASGRPRSRQSDGFRASCRRRHCRCGSLGRSNRGGKQRQLPTRDQPRRDRQDDQAAERQRPDAVPDRGRRSSRHRDGKPRDRQENRRLGRRIGEELEETVGETFAGHLISPSGGPLG